MRARKSMKQKIYLICILAICTVLCGCGDASQNADSSSSAVSGKPVSSTEAGAATKPQTAAGTSDQTASSEITPEVTEEPVVHTHITEEVIEIEGAKTAVANMHAGINIGNSLECVVYDVDFYNFNFDEYYPEWWGGSPQRLSPEQYVTLWGNPPPNRAYIKAIKDAGFDAVRLPVTWTLYCDEAGNVREEWMDYVQKIVDWILAEDMYCMINLHHDCCASNTWIQATEENYNRNAERVATIWRQIAERFQNYDEKLLFEGYNEMSAGDFFGWVPEGEDYMDWYNKYTQLFVDTVRETGGNNKTRNLIVPTFSAAIFDLSAVKAFVLPQDSVEDHLIIGVHSYLDGRPINERVGNYELREMTEMDEKAADENLDTMKYLIDKWDVPLLVTETAVGYMEDNTAAVVDDINYVVPKLRKEGIVCFWWDSPSMASPGVLQWVDPLNPAKGEESRTECAFGLFNRYQGIPVWTEVIDALVRNGWGE